MNIFEILPHEMVIEIDKHLDPITKYNLFVSSKIAQNIMKKNHHDILYDKYL